MSLKLDNLRSTIPSTIRPLNSKPRSKEQLIADVRNSAKQSNEDVKAFRESWTSEQTQQLFARSKLSLEKAGDLTKAQDVAKLGWTSA